MGGATVVQGLVESDGGKLLKGGGTVARGRVWRQGSTRGWLSGAVV